MRMGRTYKELLQALKDSAGLYQSASRVVYGTAEQLKSLAQKESQERKQLQFLRDQKSQVRGQIEQASAKSSSQNGQSQQAEEQSRQALQQKEAALEAEIQRRQAALQQLEQQHTQLAEKLHAVEAPVRAGITQNETLNREFLEGQTGTQQAGAKIGQVQSHAFGAGRAGTAVGRAEARQEEYHQGASYAHRLACQYAALLDQLLKLESGISKWAVQENGRQFLQTLTADQRQAIFDYTTERPGVPTYRNINNALRHPWTHHFAPGNKERAKNMHTALSQASIPCSCTVYRGTSRDFLGKYKGLPDEKLVGKILPERGFLSTSLNREDSFGGSLKLVIDVPKGASGAYIGSLSSAGDAESEVLFDCGQIMRVERVERDQFGQRVLYVRLLQ